MTDTQESLLVKLGFRFGINGPHAARTMMLDDLRALLSHTPVDATRADYARAIVDDNVLGKPTKSARQLAWRHLGTLYGCDPANPIFRALRRLWPLDEVAQPLLALAAALARDPLLRGTQALIVNQVPGTQVNRDTSPSPHFRCTHTCTRPRPRIRKPSIHAASRPISLSRCRTSSEGSRGLSTPPSGRKVQR